MINSSTDLYDIVIIGSGASGMMAAVTCARKGLSVLLLEHMERPGKKILVTGNGKCNLTNEAMIPEAYRGSRKMIAGMFRQYSQKDTIAFFHSIGIPVKSRDGYCYPFSEQAASVTAAFENEMQRLHVTLVCKEIPRQIMIKNQQFQIITDSHRYLGKRLILCCGGKAAPQTGSDGSLYPAIEALGHHFTDMVPALCAFSAEGLPFKKIAGVRTEAAVTLQIEGRTEACDRGEIQFTDYGVSGIPVFQISRFASHALLEGRNPLLFLDLLPACTKDQLLEEFRFRSRHFTRETAAWLLNGLLPSKLIPPLLSAAGLAMEKKIYKIMPPELEKLAGSLKALPITLKKSKGFENAQVTSGGIPENEVDPETLESRIIRGLYFAGEVLDVDAICGGYNLQWAWASGSIAAEHAAASLKS